MTPPDLSGEELDRAVAAQVFGHVVDGRCIRTTDGGRRGCPQYSRDPADAHRVMEWLQGEGYTVEERSSTDRATVTLMHGWKSGHPGVFARTVFEARCLAALAVAREKEKQK